MHPSAGLTVTPPATVTPSNPQESLLASPIILDLAILTELCQRITFCTDSDPEFQSFHSVLSIVAFLCKAPLVPEGTPVVNALFRQRSCIENILRYPRGWGGRGDPRWCPRGHPGVPIPNAEAPRWCPRYPMFGVCGVGGGEGSTLRGSATRPIPGGASAPPPPPSPPFRACLGLPPQNHMLLEHKMQRPPLGPKRCCPAGAACPITPKKAAPPTQLNGHPGTPRPPLHIDGAE